MWGIRMKLLKEITEKDIGIKKRKKVDFRLRTAARAVLIDNENNIALLFVSKHKYHKLPGGGVERNEKIEDALKREVLEETGHHLEIGKEIGIITEQKNSMKEFQTSYCWLAKVVGEKQQHAFTEKELSEGFELQWMPLEKAIKTIKTETPSDYEGKFIVTRDFIFLKEAEKLTKSK